MNSLERYLLQEEQDNIQTSFENKRNPLLYNCIVNALALANFFYRIEYNGAENIPKNGPTIVLPKHQCYVDGLILGRMIKKVSGRYSSFIMKSELPNWLEKLGGIKVVTRKRSIDLIKQMGREKAIRYAKKTNRKAYAKIQWLLNQDGLIMTFPEGKLAPKKMTNIKSSQFKYFEQMQKNIGKPIPLIPIGMEYEKLYKFHEDYEWFFPTLGSFTIYGRELFFPRIFPRNKVIVRVGEPRFFGQMSIDELVKVTSEDIKKLSNI